MTDKEKRFLAEIRMISKRGNSAEVKYDKDGNYIVYEIRKIKKCFA